MPPHRVRAFFCLAPATAPARAARGAATPVLFWTPGHSKSHSIAARVDTVRAAGWFQRAAAALSVLLLCAWTYPEHRDISAAALERLSPPRQEAMARMWASATGGSQPMKNACTSTLGGYDGSCLDLASWPAIAGDHSCSPENLRKDVVTSKWVMDVSRVAADLRRDLASARNENLRLDAWALSNLRLEAVDRDYSTRAAANSAHFLLPRTEDDLQVYLGRTISTATEPNAMGLFLHYHFSALGLAARWKDNPDDSVLAARALATEAFALHFIEDSFSAGHVAGSWGSVAERKGTHDYYCEFGLDGSTWAGTLQTLKGDAHMRPQDLERTAQMVSDAWAQFADAALGKGGASKVGKAVDPTMADTAPTVDICTATKQPVTVVPAESNLLRDEVVKQTPVPTRPSDDIHLPHFRQEVGPFIGFAAGLSGGGARGGYQSSGEVGRGFGQAEIGFRFGVGLDAVIGSSGAGLAFLQVGVVYQSDQGEVCTSGCDPTLSNSGIPRVGARNGLGTKIHLPFWLIPGDLLIAGPIVFLVDKQALKQMGIIAASGGLIPWQRTLNSGIGAFQFVLGREVGVALFGYGSHGIYGYSGSNGTITQYTYRSWQLDIPVVEYRPFRTFATNQALTVALQLGFGADFPNNAHLTNPPGAPGPDLGTSWMIYLRVAFDARYYPW